MTSIDVIPATTPRLPTKRDRKYKITAKVRAAVDAMVWQGLKRNDAAQTAGLKDNSLYVALARPDVKAYYMQQMDVLRTSEKARSIHALADVRDQTDNQMARVSAAKALLQEDDEHRSRGNAAQLPGLVVQIINNGPSSIEAKVIEPDATD